MSIFKIIHLKFSLSYDTELSADHTVHFLLSVRPNFIMVQIVGIAHCSDFEERYVCHAMPLSIGLGEVVIQNWCYRK